MCIKIELGSEILEEYEELSSRLRPCVCGGKVRLLALGYPRDTFDIKCEKCGGVWHMNTYSPIEAAKWWGMNEEKHLTTPVI